MADDIATRLREQAQAPALAWLAAAADEIDRLRISLALAVGDLSTRDEYANVEPELLMHGFLIRGMEEADCG